MDPKKQNFLITLAIIIAIAGFALPMVFFTVDETQQVVVTQFGKPVRIIKQAGLHVKLPLVQKIYYFEKRVLEWDGYPEQIPTKDKKLISIDTTARWRIKDPLVFLQSVVDEMGAQSRLDDILDAAVRNVASSYNLIEIVRSTNRIYKEFKDIKDPLSEEATIEKINTGREKIISQIIEQAAAKAPQYGIELIDVRIKRINYIESVRKRVYDRMISERKRAAEKYRSEGLGKKAEIEGNTEKELKKIISQAYKKAQEIKGIADAKANEIYRKAFSKDPEFYSFLRTLETYSNSIDSNTTLILTTEGEYFHYLNSSSE